MLECVINISEGRDLGIIAALSDGLGDNLLDVHSDPDHNRSVFTLIGEEAPRTLTSTAVQLLDMTQHDGVHPRLGVVDVVPFVPLEGSKLMMLFVLDTTLQPGQQHRCKFPFSSTAQNAHFRMCTRMHGKICSQTLVR